MPEATLSSLATDLGRYDIAIMNALGVQASVFGNHEFDLGTRAVSTAIDMTASGGKATAIGAQFPYLSANLDFSGDADLSALFTADLRDAASYATTAADLDPANIAAEAADRQIAPWTTITENGETIGVLGVTTQVLASISSIGGVKVMDPAGDGGKNNTTELATILQPLIDKMTGQGINKVILLSHLQDYTLELDLAPKLSGVDVIIGGGSHAVFADKTDTLVGGIKAAETYPVIRTGADGKPVAVVNTGGEYYNLGRLVVSFDADGVIVPASIDPAVSGAYVATEETVTALYGAEDPYAEGSRGDIVRDMTTAVDAVIDAKLAVVAGYSDVYLQGQRAFVRSQETNFGSLTADANLAAARIAAPAAAVSFKNGGGIREGIGVVGVGALPSYGPPTDGKVSQLDIENALRFNNRVMVFDTTPQGLLNILNFAASRPAGNGGFPQLGGLRFSFDPDLPAGQQVSNVALYDLDGSFVAQVVADGKVVAGAPAVITAVALNFTVNGGDGYPIKANGENFRYLLNDGTLSAAIDEALDFTAAANVPANAKGEQQAFTDYMTSNHGTPATAYNVAETPASQDLRIQNLNLRGDAVLGGAEQVFGVARLDAVQAEGNAGSKAFTFTVTRSGDTKAAAEVEWSVAGAAGPGTAPADAQDFVGGVLPGGTVSFGAGETSRLITVAVAGDTKGEANERFAVALGGLPAGAGFGGGAHGVILSDDASLSIGAVAANQAEGTGSGTTAFTFRIHRNGPAAGTQTVDWAVSGSAMPGAGAADAADFDGGVLPSGTVTFAPGDSNQLVTVLVKADSAVELNEHFAVTLSNPTGGASLGRASDSGFILHDDGSRYSVGPQVRMMAEGTGGATSVMFTVFRNGFSAGTDTLDWSVTPGGLPGTMPAGAADFEGGVLPSGTVSFAPGASTAAIELKVAADAVRELNESFTVTLANPSPGAALGNAQAKGAIIDDDTIFLLGDGDSVSGTEAANVFLIGPNAHTVLGLGGVDRFAFTAAVGTAASTNVTVLPDFDPAGGERIDLRLIDAILGNVGDDMFSFIGTAAFSGSAGELRAAEEGGSLVIAGDTNGDSVPNFLIVTGTGQTPAQGWFLL